MQSLHSESDHRGSSVCSKTAHFVEIASALIENLMENLIENCSISAAKHKHVNRFVRNNKRQFTA